MGELSRGVKDPQSKAMSCVQIQICTSTTLPVDKHNLLQARQAFRDAFNKRFSTPDEPSRSIELFRTHAQIPPSNPTSDPY